MIGRLQLPRLRVNNVKAIIVCGSPQLWLPENLAGYIVGVDRGALALIERGVDFDVAIGDFDSVSEVERRWIEAKVKVMLELPTDKGVTDCEAAVEYVVAEGYREIHLYGTTGGRFDHQFATIGLLLKYAKRDVQIYVVDKENSFFVMESGIYWIDIDREKYISFFALENAVKNLVLVNVKYPLAGYDLAVDDSLCVSNEPLGASVGVSFDTGYLLVVQSSD